MNPYQFFKKIAFSCDPEWVHNQTIRFCKQFPSSASFFFEENNFDLSCDVVGVKWSSPIGLAAGLDKNADALDFFSRIGFGAVEVGTVTPKPQVGNTKPRLFRIPQKESLRNALGFNNNGSKYLKQQLANYNAKVPIGVNLGKNKVTPNDKALKDYEILLNELSEYGDYYVINISSPNTPKLRSLQDEAFLGELAQIYRALNIPKPLFVKLDPDSEESNQRKVVEAIIKHGYSGVIATNTTRQHEWETGGVSGKKLYSLAKNVRSNILSWLSGSSLRLIGVGGFSHPQEVLDFLKQGGASVQVYTSLIYQGPGLPSAWSHYISGKISQTGASSLKEWVND